MRTSARNSILRANVNVSKLYPVEGSKTVTAYLNAENARALATRLLVLAEVGHEQIELTVFRRPRKSDGALPCRVTALRRK
jgi:hypothetical protein